MGSELICDYDPRTVPASAPIGMFHCPRCGDMVVAGLAHPAPVDDDYWDDEEDADDE